MGIGALALIASLMDFAAPKAVHAAAALLVEVANTPTSSVPMVAAPAASQLYSSSCTNYWSGGSGIGCFFAPPPAGKTLFIETMSISSVTDSAAVGPAEAEINSNNGSGYSVYIPMVQQVGGSYFVGTVAGRMWVKAGESPDCFVQSWGNSQSGGITCNAIGYLAPAQ